MTVQLLAVGLARANIVDFIDVKVTPAMHEYCHIVRFSQGWIISGLDFNGYPLKIDYYYSDYEFRVDGLLSTQFLVGAFSEFEHRHDSTTPYSSTLYRVDLSDPRAAALPGNRKNWEAAAVVPLARKSIFAPVGMVGHDKPAVFKGFQFTKSGYLWANTASSWLSPDSAWVILQSKTNATKSPELSVYQVFFDVFGTDTGRKILTIEGTYSGYGDPDGCLGRTGWLTERYFIIPLGEHRERCLVCEFGAHRQQEGRP